MAGLSSSHPLLEDHAALDPPDPLLWPVCSSMAFQHCTNCRLLGDILQAQFSISLLSGLLSDIGMIPFHHIRHFGNQALRRHYDQLTWTVHILGKCISCAYTCVAVDCRHASTCLASSHPPLALPLFFISKLIGNTHQPRILPSIINSFSLC